MRGLGNYKHMPCKREWIKWNIKIIKMSVVSELKSNRVLCFALFCLELDNLILDLIRKSKGPRITEKQFWKSTRWKNLPYRDLVWKSLVMKTIEFGQKDRPVKQNRAQPLAHPSLEIIQGRDDIINQCRKGGLWINES